MHLTLQVHYPGINIILSYIESYVVQVAFGGLLNAIEIMQYLNLLVMLVFFPWVPFQDSTSGSNNGWVELVIIEGKDLIAADLRGTSDPYVRVQYGNLKKKTKV